MVIGQPEDLNLHARSMLSQLLFILGAGAQGAGLRAVTEYWGISGLLHSSVELGGCLKLWGL